MSCKLEIIEARNLPAMDLNGRSDPYVVITFGGATNFQKFKTPTRYKTVRPVFTETYYCVGSEKGVDNVVVEVWDENTMLSDEIIGEVVFEVGTATAEKKQGDVWMKLKPSKQLSNIRRAELEKQNLGEIHIRWYYTSAPHIFSAIDHNAVEVRDVKPKEKLPQLDFKVLESNIARIRVYVEGVIAMFTYMQSVILWTRPLETILWFYVFHWCSLHGYLIQLGPGLGCAGMVRNWWCCWRYGVGSPGTTTAVTNASPTKDEQPQQQEEVASGSSGSSEGIVAQAKILHRYARYVQMYSTLALERIDYVVDCLRWYREVESMIITASLFVLTFLSLFLWLLGWLLPPAWLVTTAVVWYIFLVHPMYINFPVLKRKYHWMTIL
eukprot:PhF_6_TR40794/c0_g1_i2/m.61616